jgi:predicted NBD/HSP70 family sugar kinase
MEPALAAASPRRIRQRNEIAVLRALHRFGRLSRAELARKLRLNRSSSGHIIAGLLGAGVVRETATDLGERPERGRVGRPGVMFELVPDAVFFLGVEIGVEHISTAEIDLEAKVVSHHAEGFDGAAVGPEAAIARAVGLAFRSIDPARLERCEGIGVSVPAQMDPSGFVRLAPLLRWRDIDVPELVRRALPVPVPVLVENDANAFALGSAYGRSAPRAGVTLFVVLESGVGGGIVVDGALLRGGHGLAGEIGHMNLPDGDGGSRLLEELIGLEAVLGAGEGARPLAGFLADVRDREPGAVAIAERWSRALAYGLVQICRVIDPDHIVLGGSLAALYPLAAARVAAHVRALQEPGFPVPAIGTDPDAGRGSAFGAACMLHQRFLSPEDQRLSERVSAWQEAAV